ncbi:MAG: deoxyribodipyrimidine photo-lyase [Candidatus Thiodiazotropha taylori]
MTRSILWLRRDLRLTDHPALLAAIRDANYLLPVYIHAPEEEQPWQSGAASNWWLHNSLIALDRDLRKLESGLIIAKGSSRLVLRKLALKHRCQHLFYTHLPEPASIQRDGRVCRELTKAGVSCHQFHSYQLLDGNSIRRLDGGSYRVFTPFWRALQKQGMLQRPTEPAPKSLPPLPNEIDSLEIDRLKLLPSSPWYREFHNHWQPGEAGAFKKLHDFMQQTVNDYHTGRDRPDLSDTSRLSAHLHFGEISPVQIANGLSARLGGTPTYSNNEGASQYLRQLAWREFAIDLLANNPHTDRLPFDSRFADYPWRSDKQAKNLLQKWQRGETGIPIVDAGMRELWQTGWMHNRVRMIVASLLSKNMGINWLDGARWFWDTLVDADLANNSLGWQWSAGCGADAAPYFRIFNPVRQAERFDPNGNYIKHWLPELSTLPSKSLYAPWMAKTSELFKAGVQLGKTYPEPIVDLQSSRREALQRWESVKRRSNTAGSK